MTWYFTLLHWLMQNINQSLDSQKILQNSPWRVSYGVSIVKILEKIECYNITKLHSLFITHSLTHSTTHSHSFTHSPTHSLTLARSLTTSLFHSPHLTSTSSHLTCRSLAHSYDANYCPSVHLNGIGLYILLNKTEVEPINPLGFLLPLLWKFSVINKFWFHCACILKFMVHFINVLVFGGFH